MKHKLVTLVLSMVVAASLILVGCAKPAPASVPAPEVYEWKITSTNLPGAYFHDGIEYFFEYVEEASGGKLTMELYAGAALYAVFDALPSVATGVTEGLSVLNGKRR